MDDIFAPGSGAWRRVSARLATLYRALTIGPAVVVLAVGAVLAAAGGPMWAGVALVTAGLVLGAGGWVWSGRRQRAWGYAEQADDLLVTSGVLVRRLVVIPYGRMQFVDVEAGPLQRSLGIATVTLHTASVETAARIPGLVPTEATRLRNRLTELGQAHGAGL